MSGRMHVLKVLAPYYEALADGSKNFEVRRNDRGFQVGDELVLCEAKESSLRHMLPVETGKKIVKRITYVYSGDPRFGEWPTGTVVLGLGDPS